MWSGAHSAAAVAIAALFAFAPAGAARLRASTPVVHVSVTASRCSLSQTHVPVGIVRFVVVNHGASLEGFAVAGMQTRLLRPGRTETLTVEFAKVGSYRYRCTTGVRGRLTVTAVSAALAQPALTTLATGLGPLTDVAVAPDDPNRVFVVEPRGTIVMLDGGAPQEVANFDADVRSDGENGMLGMAFSPAFATDRTIYILYIDRVGSGNEELVSVRLNDDWTADMKSVRTLLYVDTPGGNHRGGDIAFGPDGLLYVPLGDGDNGTYTTIGQYAQDSASMLGGIVRVDPATGSVVQWAKGLRNPWRDYLDAATGLYYIGDVGESDQEEIDVVPLSGGPYNFGWPCVEGTETHTDTPVRCPDPSQLTAPVLTYTHKPGCAVIAGVVVHDPRFNSLDGSFLYTDLCDGNVRALTYANGAATDDRDTGLHVDQPTSFGEGPDGRVYIVDNGGDVYRLDPAS
jgi:glucose/arabinose dehydrogenase